MPIPIESLDPSEIVACALRPAGTWTRLLSLLAFVGAAWLVAPTPRTLRGPRTPRLSRTPRPVRR